MLVIFLLLLLSPIALADNFWGSSTYQSHSPYQGYSSSKIMHLLHRHQKVIVSRHSLADFFPRWEIGELKIEK